MERMRRTIRAEVSFRSHNCGDNSGQSATVQALTRLETFVKGGRRITIRGNPFLFVHRFLLPTVRRFSVGKRESIPTKGLESNARNERSHLIEKRYRLASSTPGKISLDRFNNRLLFVFSFVLRREKSLA